MRLFSSATRLLPAALALLFVVAIFHIGFGAKAIALGDIWQAIWAFDDRNFDHVVIRQMRLPRLLAAMTVGASLSVAGALMQGVTRNPLADPGLLGLLSGASFGVVVGAAVLGIDSDSLIPVFAVLGALAAALLVAAISFFAPGANSRAMLLLAGAAVSLFLAANVSALNLLNEEGFASFRVWLSGAITTDAAKMLPWCLPWCVIGLAVALFSARQVTALSMGHKTATGLGVDTKKLSLRLLFCVVSLTAASVALVGPLGFVGLVVPHATRLVVGSDYRHVIPFSALFGAIFLLIVDLVARTVLSPVEISTGVVTSLLGAPLFLVLIRRVL
ncbi:iron ABC transporter permease [Hwanghaeella grinnelliae]|uniref:Iron ABC transporter permease n=1 Tax=Hwanghaeella grinnelliae TaxID=2500179 RepID=A0A3S2WPC0_9PROT|nr:iron ABC transporter permease [Hwanghaeella grinnelliae]RVU33925.1 iron ABC transporter permease [Hwanghaeella grinnelliae]